MKRIVEWFEHGDLVPLLVIVSAVHYAAVLANRDVWPVAIAIGVLVDLGHFRTIRAAFRYPISIKISKTSKRRRMRVNGQLVARWLIALTMTAISLAYHQRYYMDWWLSAPIPFLIAALAWLQQVDRQPAKNATHSVTHSETVRRNPSRKKIDASHVCAKCGASFAKTTELANHTRWQHPQIEPERTNGKVKV